MAQNDSWNSIININYMSMYAGLYYYFLPNSDSSGIISNCPATVSCLFSPILDFEDLETYTVSYDTNRFSKDGVEYNGYAYLNRIQGIKRPNKKLKEFPKYPEIKRSTEKSWRNESRLYQYPYSYAMITDYINPPFEVQYHLVNDKVISVWAKAILSDKLSYSIYVSQYKNDYNGVLEGSVNTGVLDVPCGSSAYAMYSSSQKSQDMFNYNSSLQNLRFSQNKDLTNQKMSGFSDLVGGLLSGSFTGALGAGMNAYSNYVNYGLTQSEYAMKQAQAIGLKNAEVKDLKNTPRSMINTGSDISFNLLNGDWSIDFYRMGLTEEYYYRLGEYFYRYGYTLNEYRFPNIKSRYYFNYIQTIDLLVTSPQIPKIHLQEIKDIFDKGTTFWHFNHRAEMYNYNDENYEVN